MKWNCDALSHKSLNAPDGAGCSLTPDPATFDLAAWVVLMHLMVLGAP